MDKNTINPHPFLKHPKAQEFKEALEALCPGSYSKFLFSYDFHIPPNTKLHDILIQAFSWSFSPEGRYYWEGIYHKLSTYSPKAVQPTKATEPDMSDCYGKMSVYQIKEERNRRLIEMVKEKQHEKI